MKKEVQHLEAVVLPVQEESPDPHAQLLGIAKVGLEQAYHVTPVVDRPEGDRDPSSKAGEVKGGVSVPDFAP